ncbi:MAG: LysR family transcriptional regulator [Myxococcota bacterium]|nr:LysR family transcriptional regulator [Myxococcota bacterium]
MTLELRPLRHFEAVHRLRSFRRAAEEQAITQSAITRSVQRLEEQLGLRLFDRTTRSVSPTPAGDALLGPALSLLGQADALAREARLLGGAESGTVAVGASPLPLDSLVAPALIAFATSNPGVGVEARSGPQEGLVEDLLSRRLDFAVIGGVAFDEIPFVDEIAIQRLPAEPAVILARTDHPLVVSDAPSEAWLDFPWAAPRLASDAYARFPEPFAGEMRRRGIPQLRLESLSACIQLVEESDVLSGAPLSVGSRAEARGGVSLIPFPFPLETAYAVLSLQGRTPTPAAAALREAIGVAARASARGAAGEMGRIQARVDRS